MAPLCVLALAVLLLACMLLALCACNFNFGGVTNPKKTTSSNGGADPVPDPIDDNYRTLYQIYVRSFADSDGNGKGDIRGIIETFDYLND